MPNMVSTIASHNKIVSGPPSTLAEGGRNCRKGITNCPLSGKCQSSSLGYKWTVTSTGENSKEYTGLNSDTFKERFTGHTASFDYKKLAHGTALSKHIWALKSNNKHDYTTTRSVLKHALSYSPTHFPSALHIPCAFFYVPGIAKTFIMSTRSCFKLSCYMIIVFIILWFH